MESSSVWMIAAPDKKAFPKLAGQKKCDVIVIGGGIVGVSTAVQLAQQNKKVILLEKNHIGTGDSGATTGFLTRVPDTSTAELQKKHGATFVKQLYQTIFESQQAWFKKLEMNAETIDFKRVDSFFGGYSADDAILREEWEAIQPAEQDSAWNETSPERSPFTATIHFKQEGRFHIRKYLFQLLKNTETNLTVFEESDALSIDSNACVIETAHGSVQAEKIIIAIGNPTSLFPELAPLVREYVTSVALAQFHEPVLSPHLYWDTQNPYFYFRTVDANTIMIGGTDRLAEQKSERKPVDVLQTFLRGHFAEPFEITHSWSGSLFETQDGLPYVFEHPRAKNVFVATGFGGNGLVIGNLASEILSALVQKQSHAGIELFSPTRNQESIGEHIIVKQTTAEGQKQFVAIANTSEFANRSSLVKTVQGRTIALFHLANQYYAIDNACTHARGPLGEGTLEGSIVTCPLHGAQFDVTTGQVKRAPAIRPVMRYQTRMVGDQIEVEIPIAAVAKPIPEEDPFLSLRLFFIGGVVLFFMLELIIQHHFFDKSWPASRSFSEGWWYDALVASAFTGATLISTALFSSAIFKWFPNTATWWRLRRYLGVSGVTFILVHVFLVWLKIYEFNLDAYLYSWNPIKNPALFGSLALPIFLLMAMTSTDWAVKKLTFKRWKRLHRLVYIAYPLSIFHYLSMNPPMLKSPGGTLLLIMTTLAVFGQLYWFFHTAIKARFRTVGSAIGLMILIGSGILLYFLFA